VPEQGEAGAAVHLPLDHFRFRVHALGPAVVVREGERCRDGLNIEVQAAGEGVQVGKVGGPGLGDPLLEPAVVARGGGQQGREGCDEAGQGGHLRAGGGEPGERLSLPGREVIWPGEQDPGGPAG
jgi:hypothetical protein